MPVTLEAPAPASPSQDRCSSPRHSARHRKARVRQAGSHSRSRARAGILTLRHRVVGYRAGESRAPLHRGCRSRRLLRQYGYVLRHHHGLMHPRTRARPGARLAKRRRASCWSSCAPGKTAHPRVVDPALATARSPIGSAASTNATTRLLDEMHYRGLLRVARRDSGTRVYAVRRGLRWSRRRPSTSASTRW